MNVKVKIELNPRAIQTLEKAIELSAEQAAEAVLSEVKSLQIIPYAKRDLQDSGMVKPSTDSKLKFKVSFDTPYARRLYWNPEYDFRTDMNPYAQGMWMQPFIDGYRKNYFKDSFNESLKTNAKGLIK